jgi:hypothetical protein
MNANFKPLGLAAAVATATAGYAGYANAQASYASATELGDLAIVPYYTVMEGFATGVNIINTANETQVIKFRFRRATDSMDALDFNVVLSPYDMYTGFISAKGDDIVWRSNDNSCTAPALDANGEFVMPDIYREDAETGYIEIISMGSADSAAAPIAIAAKHGSDGMPADCDAVRDNFFANDGADPTVKGVLNSAQTVGPNISKDGAPLETSNYVASTDSLKVSYFIKSDATGTEFGDNAVHVADFMNTPAITNQQKGIFSRDLQGFDYPDLNGGSPLDVAGPLGNTRGAFNGLRAILSAPELINDWSANERGDFSVDTDWVVTFPGQYVMLNLGEYIPRTIYGAGNEDQCKRVGEAVDVAAGDVALCDYRDIPAQAVITVYDREERGITISEGDLVVSPQPPGEITEDVLKSEVNVITWGVVPVLDAASTISVPGPVGAEAGWAKMGVTQWAGTEQAVCDITGLAPNSQPTLAFPFPVTCASTSTPVPLVGMVAWQRNFGANPDANYGRIVGHSYVTSN